MKADFASMTAASAAERRQHAGLSEKASALLVGAGLAMIACGIVAAVLWFAWRLAEILP
jgi:hypothetical protein